MQGMIPFSRDYATARRALLSTAAGRGCTLRVIPHEALAPDDQALATDVVWMGDPDANRVVLHCSGLHGVEGFAGSAIQTRYLCGSRDLPSGVAICFLHAINPWGMSWLRRVNDSNVDLNRNWLPQGEHYSGSPDGYHAVNELLNPPKIHWSDLFMLRAGLAALRHGYGAVKQAVVCGQNDYPAGLFFGGHQRQPALVGVYDFLAQHLADRQRLLVIDVHTGLGTRAQASLFVRSRTTELEVLRERFGDAVTEDDTGANYQIRGGFEHLVLEACPQVSVDHLMQEFGTYPALQVLAALRAENAAFHQGERRSDHPARQWLLESFAPASPRWQHAVVVQGAMFIDQAVAFLAGN